MSTSRSVDQLTYTYYNGQDGSEPHGPNCHTCMNELFRENKLLDVQTVSVFTQNGPVDFLIGSLAFSYGRETPFSITSFAVDFLVLSCTRCEQKAKVEETYEALKDKNEATTAAGRKRLNVDSSNEVGAPDKKQSKPDTTSVVSCQGSADHFIAPQTGLIIIPNNGEQSGTASRNSEVKLTAFNPGTTEDNAVKNEKPVWKSLSFHLCGRILYIEFRKIDGLVDEDKSYTSDYTHYQSDFKFGNSYNSGRLEHFLKECSYVGEIIFKKTGWCKEYVEVLTETNTGHGHLHVELDIMDINMGDFIRLCSKFKGSKFFCDFKNPNLWSDKVFTKVLPHTTIVRGASTTTRQSNITDETLDFLMNGQELPNKFQINNICTSFTVKKIVQVLKKINERKVKDLNWDLGILSADQLADAKRFFDGENGELNAIFKTTVKHESHKIIYKIEVEHSQTSSMNNLDQTMFASVQFTVSTRAKI